MGDPAALGEQETVGAIAELYLGNIMYALELAAMELEDGSGGTEAAAFYRGIARKLAAARGRARTGPTQTGTSGGRDG